MMQRVLCSAAPENVNLLFMVAIANVIIQRADIVELVQGIGETLNHWCTADYPLV
jgi:hypothetical protein